MRANRSDDRQGGPTSAGSRPVASKKGSIWFSSFWVRLLIALRFGKPLRAHPIEEFCVARFPDHYTRLGLPADRERDPPWAIRRAVLIVYRVPGSGLDDAVRQAFPNKAVTFQDASVSRKELIALCTRIWADRDALARQDVRVSGFTILDEKVEVGTPDVDRARQLLPELYGPSVTVTYHRVGARPR